MSDTYTIGHNTATLPLHERLELEYADLGERISAKLLEARDLPAEIGDDADNEKVSEAIKGIRSLLNEGEADRKKEVEPHLTAQRDTNAFFKGFSDRLTKAKEVLEGRVTKYLRKKAEEERERRIEAERLAREEADRKLREAQLAEEQNQPVIADFALQRAEQAEQRANLASAAAEDRPAEMARTSFSGGTSTLKGSWTFKVEDYTKIDLNTLRPYLAAADLDKAIRGFVRSGGRQLSGVRIYEDFKASVR